MAGITDRPQRRLRMGLEWPSPRWCWPILIPEYENFASRYHTDGRTWYSLGTDPGCDPADGNRLPAKMWCRRCPDHDIKGCPSKGEQGSAVSPYCRILGLVREISRRRCRCCRGSRHLKDPNCWDLEHRNGRASVLPNRQEFLGTTVHGRTRAVCSGQFRQSMTPSRLSSRLSRSPGDCCNGDIDTPLKASQVLSLYGSRCRHDWLSSTGAALDFPTNPPVSGTERGSTAPTLSEVRLRLSMCRPFTILRWIPRGTLCPKA